MTVHTGGTDDISGIASCTSDQSQTDETTGQTLTGTCTNKAGLTSGDELTVKLDKTGPSAVALPRAAPLGANGWFIDDVTVSTDGDDDVSGPVTCTADAAPDDRDHGSVLRRVLHEPRRPDDRRRPP